MMRAGPSGSFSTSPSKRPMGCIRCTAASKRPCRHCAAEQRDEHPGSDQKITHLGALRDFSPVYTGMDHFCQIGTLRPLTACPFRAKSRRANACLAFPKQARWPRALSADTKCLFVTCITARAATVGHEGDLNGRVDSRVRVHEEASCPSQRAHRRFEGPDRSPACTHQVRAGHGTALRDGGVNARCARREPRCIREASRTDPGSLKARVRVTKWLATVKSTVL